MSSILDKLLAAEKSFGYESMTVSDNPIIDLKTGEAYHGANFLACAVSSACDDIRYAQGLLVKCLDVIIGHLHEPSMSDNLPNALLAENDGVNIGLKGV